MCDKILEESGVLGDVSIEVYPLHFIPLEQDLLSLCLDEAFRDLYLVSWCPSKDSDPLTPARNKTLPQYSLLLKRSCRFRLPTGSSLV